MRIFVLSLCMLWPLGAFAATGIAARTIAQLERRPAATFRVPAIVKRTLANGMHCFFLEDHTLPLFSFRILLPTGSVYDPPDSIGLNGMMLGLLRTGGSLRHGPDAMDALLDQKAITITAEAGSELSSMSLNTLSSAQDEGLGLLWEIVFTPAFAPERISLAKGKVYEALRRQNDHPGGIAEREFRKLIFGATSPWARTPRHREIERMTRQDLEDAHAAMLAPDHCLCAAAGDIHPDHLVMTLNRLVGLYPQKSVPYRAPPDAPPVFRQATQVINKAADQSTILVGHRGSTRFNPDRYALLVMNEILGSPNTLSNWLTQKIRTERGLVYGVWSTFGFGPEGAPGLFQVEAKTRPEKVGEVVQYIREAVAKMTEGAAVTEQEMAVMKGSLLKRIIFEYEEPFNIVAETARFAYFGFPDDYIERYRRGITAVTLDDVRRVAKKYLHPEALQTLIVGDPQRMHDGLKDLGPLQRRHR